MRNPFLGSMCVLRRKQLANVVHFDNESWYKSNSGIEPRNHIRKAISVDESCSGKDQIRRPFSKATYSDGCIARPSVIKTSKAYKIFTIVIAEKTTN